MAINSYFSKIGTSDPIVVHTKMQDLIDAFDITKFSQAPTQFNIDDVVKLNPKVLHRMSFSDVENRLRDLNITSPDLWNFISGNVEKFSDVKKWIKICRQNIIPVIDESNKEFIKVALSVFPNGEIDQDTWETWITNIKKNTNRKSKDIFIPLRLALTGISTGPELAKLLPLLGRTEIIRRLSYSDIC